MSSPRGVRAWSRRRRIRAARTAVVAVTVVVAGVVWHPGWGGSPGHPGALADEDPLAFPDPPAQTATPVDPTIFAAGSCMAFPPTKGNRGVTVFLDAGHGGPDPGGAGVTEAGRSIDERALTLPVVLDATAVLRADGIRVVVSRTTSSSVVKPGAGDLSGTLWSLSGKHRDTAARPLCANMAHAAVLVSVHFNVGAQPSEAGTLTTYDAVRPFSPSSLALATLLQTDMVAALHSHPGWMVPDDGVVTDGTVGNALSSAAAGYGHLLVLGPAKQGYFSDPSSMPGALIEPLFLTDPFEGSIAASSQGQQVIGHAIAQAVERYLASRRP
jgi:N-acetylmuramoyl-L-alanine amidase